MLSLDLHEIAAELAHGSSELLDMHIAVLQV